MPDQPTPALHAEIVGAGLGPRLVAAHGFTQTGRVWGGLLADLATDHQVVAVDMPGHGSSADVAADLVAGGELLARAGGRATYLGYSMGARSCLHLALARPELVDGLVLVSGTAGIDGADERATRRAADEALAAELDVIARSGQPGQLAAFIDRWLEGPLFAGIPAEAAGREERGRNTAAGLASSLRLAGTGTQQPLWDRMAELTMPVLVVTGGLDGKFTALGRRLVEAMGPNATHVVVPGAGHAPHLQQPGIVAASVRHFIADEPGPAF